MKIPAEVAPLHEKLRQEFPHAHALTELVLGKLALNLYKQERCEEVLERARRAMRSVQWNQAPAEQKEEFSQQLRLTRARLEELRRAARNYTKSLDEARRAFSPTTAL